MSTKLSSKQVISISTGTILRTFGILVAFGVLWLIRDVLLYVFTALLLAGVMYPFADWASRHKIPKGVAVAAFYLLLFGIIILAFVLLIPAVLHEVGMFAGTYGDHFSWVNEGWSSLRELTTKLGVTTDLQTGVSNISSQILQRANGIFATVGGVLSGFVGVVVVLVLSFYIIVEDSAIATLFRDIIPAEYQKFASSLVWDVMSRLGDWLRGQIVLGGVIGILSFIVFSIVGLPYAILLALFAGLLEFIPYVGPLISAIPAVIIAATISPLHVLATLIGILVMQQLENHILVPKIMERAVGLNPIMSIVALLIGAQLFGLVGALFAIPVATALSVVAINLFQYHKQHQR
ncbi:AI-2E family transporter [Patescibacteria group bacterium]|nr:AI-2E family transporter [Patescibacteria group bacterium]